MENGLMPMDPLTEHECDLPQLTYLAYGYEFVCPGCGKLYVKVDSGDAEGSAYWETEE